MARTGKRPRSIGISLGPAAVPAVFGDAVDRVEGLGVDSLWLSEMVFGSLVEPFAGDAIADNLNPVGRMYYGASTLVCVPVSLARNGPALGAQAGERRLREIMVDQGGFSTMRRATETPFNIVLEARP